MISSINIFAFGSFDIIFLMMNPDYHKNDGESLLSKIIFDCATKAKVSVHVYDLYDFVQVRRYGYLWCTAKMTNGVIRLDFKQLSGKIDSRISPKYWHILVRPDTMDHIMDVNVNDPNSFNEIVELFIALRPIK